MALTELQRRVCRLFAERRAASGERYLAGGAALNELLGAPRISSDIDLFHDTNEALERSYAADLEVLTEAGLIIGVLRRMTGFAEVSVRDGTDSVEVQWVRDSAYRFFPLLMHVELGLILHPFDLATNKVLALVGRVAVRDWIDTLTCHRQVSPLGCLAWAASGKDPGLSPRFIVEEAARTARYSAPEFDALAWDGPRPDRTELGRQWREALADARAMTDLLPPEQVGNAVLIQDGAPFCGTLRDLEQACARGSLRFHRGSIGGAVPVVRATTSPPT